MESADSVSVWRDDWQTLWYTISCVSAHSITSSWEKTSSKVSPTWKFSAAEQFWEDPAEPYLPSNVNILHFFKVRIRITQRAFGVPNFWASPPSSPPALWDTWHSSNRMDLESGPDLQHDPFLRSVSLMQWYRQSMSLMRICSSNSFVPCFNSAVLRQKSHKFSVSWVKFMVHVQQAQWNCLLCACVAQLCNTRGSWGRLAPLIWPSFNLIAYLMCYANAGRYLH